MPPFRTPGGAGVRLRKAGRNEPPLKPRHDRRADASAYDYDRAAPAPTILGAEAVAMRNDIT